MVAEIAGKARTGTDLLDLWFSRPLISVRRDSEPLPHHPLLRILVHFILPRIDVIPADEVVQLKRLAQDNRLIVRSLHRRGLPAETLAEDGEAAHLRTRLRPDRDSVAALGFADAQLAADL